MEKTSTDREHLFISGMSEVLHNPLEIMNFLKNKVFPVSADLTDLNLQMRKEL